MTEDETAVVTAVQVEKTLTKASDEAVQFITNIETLELQNCLFSDSLVTVSEGGRELGEFRVTVELTRRVQRPCLLLRVVSQGAIDDTPCGTRVTAYLSTAMDILEQDHHEFVKVHLFKFQHLTLDISFVKFEHTKSTLQLQDRRTERRCHMVQRDGQMVIDTITTVGAEVTKKSEFYALSDLTGLVTEGSDLLLMRLMALKGSVPENMTFLSLDQESRITHTSYRALGPKPLAVGCEMVEVFGVERTVKSMEDVPPTVWQCYFLADGHLASRVQVGSPVTMRLLLLPPQLETDAKVDKPLFEKKPLVWEEDLEMQSKFLDRKEELKADHASYLRQHPELRALLADFLQLLLLRKPGDIFNFAREYFLPFAPHKPPGQHFYTSSP